MNRKLMQLRRILAKMESVLIAYSGGVDSTFLLRVAKDVLNQRVLAVTALSPTFPPGEYRAARSTARHLEVQHLCIRTDELACEDFVRNTPQR